MYTFIAIFYISIVGIFVMIVLKRKEIKSGKPNLVSRIGKGTDHICSSIIASVHRSISYFNRHTFVALANWIAYHILFRVRNIYVNIKDRFISNPHGKKLIDAVRGRGEVKSHGASFYLRRISEK
jgi:hypothetical protein